MLKSSMLTKEAILNFQLVARIAEVIGLADCPPQRLFQSPYISNQPLKKTRVRKCNQSDILPIERQLQSQRKKSKQTNRENYSVSQNRSFRKGAIVDIFVNCVKPEEDPMVCAKTKSIILRSDLARARKQALQRDHIKKIAINKSQRSKILNQLSEQMFFDKQPKPSTSKQKYWFKEYRNHKAKNSRSFSQQKLAESLDLSKFRLISKNEGIQLKSRQCKSEMRTQTASGGRRRLINMQFNGNNKAELVYPLAQSRAQL